MKNQWPRVTSNGSQKQIVTVYYLEQSHVATQNDLQLTSGGGQQRILATFGQLLAISKL